MTARAPPQTKWRHFLRGVVSANFDFWGMVFWSKIFMIFSENLGENDIFEPCFLSKKMSFFSIFCFGDFFFQSWTNWWKMRKSEFWKKYSCDQRQTLTQVLGKWKLKLSSKNIFLQRKKFSAKKMLIGKWWQSTWDISSENLFW